MFKSTVEGIETFVGGSKGTYFTGGDNAETFLGGKSDDVVRGKGGSDTLSGDAGSDRFIWLKKDTADGVVDHVKDFTIGEDRLALNDFLKGQHIAGGATYDDVIHIVDSADHSGALVQGLVNGAWHDIAVLDGHDASTLTLHDLGL